MKKALAIIIVFMFIFLLKPTTAIAKSKNTPTSFIAPLDKKTVNKNNDFFLDIDPPSEDEIWTENYNLIDWNSSLLAQITMEEFDVSQTKFEGIYKLAIREIRRTVRDYLQKDREHFMNGTNDSIQAFQYESFIIPYQTFIPFRTEKTTKKYGYSFGRTHDYATWGPVSLSNQFRIRIDLDQIETWLFGQKEIGSYADQGSLFGPSVSDINDKMMRKTRVSLKASANKEGFRNVSARFETIIQWKKRGGASSYSIKKMNLPISFNARYNIQEREASITFKASIFF